MDINEIRIFDKEFEYQLKYVCILNTYIPTAKIKYY